MIVDDLVGAVITYLKGKKQLELLPQVAEALTQASYVAVDKDLGTVTTAVPLAAGQKNRLSQTLAKICHRPIRIKTLVDPEIIGGMKISLAGKVIDTSLNKQLNDLNETLLYD